MAPKVAIGAYVYRVQVRKVRDYTALSFSEDDLGLKLRQAFLDFTHKFSEPEDKESTNRRWYFSEMEQEGSGYQGTVEYGRTGFSSRLIDLTSRQVQYERVASDLDFIPLFNRFWVPDEYEFGLWVFQSFSGYSCNALMLDDFARFWRSRYETTRLAVSAVLPEELKQVREAPEKAVVLKTKTGGGAIADRQLGVNHEDAGISFEISARGRDDFGTFGSLKRRFTGKQLDEAMEMDGILFEDAQAKVKINGRTRRVTLAGTGSMNALIDLSRDVKTSAGTGHPTKPSISAAFDEIVKDVVVGMLE